MSPYSLERFLRNSRLWHTNNLLQSSELNVSQITELCGEAKHLIQ